MMSYERAHHWRYIWRRRGMEAVILPSEDANGDIEGYIVRLPTEDGGMLFILSNEDAAKYDKEN